MDIWYYLKEIASSKTALVTIYYTALIIAVVTGYMWKVKPIVRQFLEFFEDWRGEHERPGVTPRPGVMVRIAALEEDIDKAKTRIRQLEKLCKDNGLDTPPVEKAESAAKQAAKEILAQHPLFPNLKTGEQYVVSKAPKPKADTESVSSSSGSGAIPSSNVVNESLLRTSSIPRIPSSGK